MRTAKEKFRKGDRVRLSAKGRDVRKWKGPDRRATVVGFGSHKFPYLVHVVRDGNVTREGFNQDFWERDTCQMMLTGPGDPNPRQCAIYPCVGTNGIYRYCLGHFKQQRDAGAMTWDEGEEKKWVNMTRDEVIADINRAIADEKLRTIAGSDPSLRACPLCGKPGCDGQGCEPADDDPSELEILGEVGDR